MFRNQKSASVFILSLSFVMAVIVGCSPAAQPTPTADSSVPPASEEPTTSIAGENITTSEIAESVTCTKLNLNNLTEDDLMTTIPDFSSRMVREFFEYRPYISIQQFRLEIGKYVDEAQVADYEQYVYVPVDPNESDADTLMQLPGVDQALAETLIAARPYASVDAFLEALSQHLSGVQFTESGCYVVETL